MHLVYAKHKRIGIASNSREFSGKIVCAPKKSSSAATTDCAYALQTSDGKVYLINAAKFPAGVNIDHYENDSAIVVTGNLTADTAEKKLYDITGVIAATQVRRQ